MQDLREKIISSLNETTGDDDLVSALSRIVEEHGNRACQAIFDVLVHLNFEPHEAEEYWRKVTEHYEKLNSRLSRKISLRTALCDYFHTIEKKLVNPKLIEISLFEKTDKLTRFDSLTGLFNRRYFDDALIREISRAKRYYTDLSILFFDLDDFKLVNDYYGHLAGDLVLQEVAQILLHEKRDEDIAARYGGEELILILPQTSKANALVTAERIREKVAQKVVKYRNQNIRVTLSGGVASFPYDGASIMDLLNDADNALYNAKTTGKNKITLFSADKRRFIRIDFCKVIKVKEIGFDNSITLSGNCKNLSAGGLLFLSNKPFGIGTRVQLELTFNNENPQVILGTVVRVEDFQDKGVEIGISFLEADKTAKSEILHYLLKQLEEKNL